MNNKELIKNCKEIHDQFVGIGNDEDFMWQEIIDLILRNSSASIENELLEWIKSLVISSNHGLNNFDEYDVMNKSVHVIIKERRELLAKYKTDKD